MHPSPTVSLPARQLFEITDAAGVRILCTAGSLWLTLDHDTRDVVLGPGESFETDQPRRALLYAFEAASFRLEPALPRHVGRRQSGWSRSPVVWAATRSAAAG